MRPWVGRSPRDGRLHLIRRHVGDVAEALCSHSVPVGELEDPGDEDERCTPCLLNFGTALADRLGPAVEWRT
jgi:hypothetical protein